MKLRLVVVAGAVVAVAVAVPASALVASPVVSLNKATAKAGGGSSKGNPKAKDGTDARTCDSADDGTNTVTYTGPMTMWPPNHKMRDFKIVANDSSGDDEVTLFSVITSSQPDNGAGDGNTENDSAVDHSTGDAAMGTPSAENNGQLRGERSGPDKAGRTYTIEAMATFDNGTSMCTQTFTVTVPHDQGNKSSKRSARR